MANIQCDPTISLMGACPKETEPFSVEDAQGSTAHRSQGATCVSSWRGGTETGHTHKVEHHSATANHRSTNMDGTGCRCVKAAKQRDKHYDTHSQVDMWKLISDKPRTHGGYRRLQWYEWERDENRLINQGRQAQEILGSYCTAGWQTLTIRIVHLSPKQNQKS